MLVLVSDGLSNAEIAQALGVAPTTVAHHIADMLVMAGARTRAHLVTIAVRRGWLLIDLEG